MQWEELLGTSRPDPARLAAGRPPSTRLPPPTATAPLPATTLNGFPQLVQDLGGSAADLLTGAKVDAATVDRPGRELPFLAAASLFEQAAHRLACPDFGIRLGFRQDPVRRYKPLVGVITNAGTVGDVLDWQVSHGHAFTAAFRSTRVADRDRRLQALRYHMPGDGLPIFRQFTETIVVLTARAISELSGGVARAREIWFSHTPISELSRYRAAFDAPVKFGQEFDALLFSDEAVMAPVIDADSERYRIEQEMLLRRVPAGSDLFELQVRETIRELLRDGGCGREDVARALGISQRTLNRKIGDCGKSFGQVRDEVRRNLAVRYLLSPELPLSLISARLGYAEVSVFSRSCQRWFGSSPRDVRHQLIAAIAEVM